MTIISEDTSINEFQKFISEVYNLSNDRHFELSEMLNNIQRFAMRGLKGIRKNDVLKTKKNLIISFSWFISTLNRLHLDLEDEVWKRFPYLCSYCGFCPCECKAKKVDKRLQVSIDNKKRPKTLKEYQEMFSKIYPASSRTLDHAGVHLAEETGEFLEALIAYRGERSDEDFQGVLFEAADYFSCLIGVFNSLNISLVKELKEIFHDNCHECHNSPCTCSYIIIKKFKF